MEKLRSASIPHIQLKPTKKACHHFSIHTRVMQCGWKNSGRYAIYFSILVIVSVLVPYTISLAEGNVKPMLPALSQAGADTLRSGLVSVGLFLTALVGSVMISVRYVHVSSLNESGNWKLTLFNKLGLSVGFVSFTGLVILASFPVKVDKSPLELWASSVFLVHMTGAFFAFFFGAMYLLMQTGISLFYYESNKQVVWIRFVIFMVCAVCFVTSTVSTLPDQPKPIESGNFPTGVFARLSTEPNLLASACEWILVFFFALYFLTFAKESESISASFTFRHVLTGRRISIVSLTNISKI